MDDVFSIEKESVLCVEPVVTGGMCIEAGFTTRIGGRSSKPWDSMNLGLTVGDDPKQVLLNRQIAAKTIGFPLENWVCAEQVHGTAIASVGTQDAGAGAFSRNSIIAGVDGLITQSADLLLALTFADCVPLYFYVKDPPTVAMYHAGWRGTVHGGAGIMVERLMEQLHLSSPEPIHAIVGPAIGIGDYEVDHRVMHELETMKRDLWEPLVVKKLNGKYLLGLQQLNHRLLVDAGVSERHVQVTRYTTFVDWERFFSFRRDGGCTGRMIGFIGMKPMKESEYGERC
ncbi:MAG: polyphenol oxidase family protein [Sporolactobacillus sp.]